MNYDNIRNPVGSVKFKIILYVFNLQVIIISGAAPGCMSARKSLIRHVVPALQL